MFDFKRIYEISQHTACREPCSEMPKGPREESTPFWDFDNHYLYALSVKREVYCALIQKYLDLLSSCVFPPWSPKFYVCLCHSHTRTSQGIQAPTHATPCYCGPPKAKCEVVTDQASRPSQPSRKVVCWANIQYLHMYATWSSRS